METRLIRLDEKGAWNKMVLAHPFGSVEQSWEWGELQTRIPGRPVFYVIGLFKGANLVGGMLMIRQMMGGGKSWLWCPRGPVLPEDAGLAEECFTAILHEASVLAKVAGDVFLRFEPGAPENHMPASFKEMTESDQSYMPEHSLTLDLALSEAELLAGMTQKGRYNIKKARAAGINVRKGDTSELSKFYDILLKTAKRDGFGIHSQNFYENFMRLPDKSTSLYLAEAQGELLAGALLSRFGNCATYYYGASSHAEGAKMAPYLLQWEMISDAKKDGFSTYDFLGVAPENDMRHALKGVTQFKTRFGGERVAYAKTRVVIFRPLHYFAYKASKIFLKYARNFPHPLRVFRRLYR